MSLPRSHSFVRSLDSRNAFESERIAFSSTLDPAPSLRQKGQAQLKRQVQHTPSWFASGTPTVTSQEREQPEQLYCQSLQPFRTANASTAQLTLAVMYGHSRSRFKTRIHPVGVASLFVVPSARPNPSFEASPNGIALGPRGAFGT